MSGRLPHLARCENRMPQPWRTEHGAENAEGIDLIAKCPAGRSGTDFVAPDFGPTMVVIWSAMSLEGESEMLLGPRFFGGYHTVPRANLGNYGPARSVKT